LSLVEEAKLAIATGRKPRVRNPDDFVPGSLKESSHFWERLLLPLLPEKRRTRILRWIKEVVTVDEFFHPFEGSFECGPAKGCNVPSSFKSDTPTPYRVGNHPVELPPV
jgi:hypothetical protein